MIKLRIKVTDSYGGWAHFDVLLDDSELRLPGSSPLSARRLIELDPFDWLEPMSGDGVSSCTIEVVE